MYRWNKRLITIIGTLIIFFTFSLTVTAAKSKIILNDKSGIPDQVLYSAILAELEKDKSEAFTEKEASEIIFLDVESYGKRHKVKTLKGIGYLKNLAHLNLSSNNLTNLSYLKKLKSLNYLNLSHNKLTSLSGIKDLKYLDTLIASNNKLTSLKGIEKLFNISQLDVSNNQIKSINGIKNFVNLDTINFEWNKITDIKQIENLTKLKSISFMGNKLKFLPDLTNHINLIETNFKYNQISEKELSKRLPLKFKNNTSWFKSQVKLQNLLRTINLEKPRSFNKINIDTKKITGKANKNSTISLRDPNGKKIVSVKTDSKGKFTFKNLNLKKWAGMTLSLQSYVVDQLYGEKNILKEVKFTVPK